jgi:Zn-dependent peptidase ImmA (M78 family)
MAFSIKTPPAWKALRDKGMVSADEILRTFGVHAPPVNVDAIARGLGIIVHYVPNPGWDGAVSSSEERAEVWIRESDAAVRQRFTLAHEIGHLLLHPLGVAYRDTQGGTMRGFNPMERAANQFAASLLMPTWMVRAAWGGMSGDAWSLSRLFDVSEQAMSIRLNDLGYWHK